MNPEENQPVQSIQTRNRSGTVRVFVLAELAIALIFYLVGIGLVIAGFYVSSGLTSAIGGIILITAIWCQLALMMYRLITYQIAALKEISPTLINLHRLLTALFKSSK